MNDPVFSSFVLCVPQIVSLSKELVYVTSSCTATEAATNVNQCCHSGELTSKITKMEDSDLVHVGDTFIRMAPVFKMYQNYINKYAISSP